MHINHVATLASKLGSVSRKDIFELIQDLCHTENPMLTDEMQSKLYRHFMPRTPKKVKTDFDWVALAVGTGPIRPQLNHVYVDENGRMSATDGKRLHMAPSGGLEPGFYNSQCVRIEHDWTYPDIDRIIPQGDLESKTWHQGGDVISMTPKGATRSIDAYVMIDRCMINREYLDAAIQGQQIVEFRCEGDRNPMLFNKLEGDRVAVIMPIPR